MPTKLFVTELVNAFNLNNYYFDNINTNFAVLNGTKGDKIISLFRRGGDIKKYSEEIRKEIIKRHCGTEEAAGWFYNLNYFPFVFDGSFSKKRKRTDKNVVVKLADLMDDKVIHNLKLHFAREFQQAVRVVAIENLKQKAGMTKEEALRCIRGSILLEKMDGDYLYCISFSDKYCKEKGYPPRFLEVFKNIYVTAFNSRLEQCGFNDSSIFYKYIDDRLYIKDITNINVIRDILRCVKEEIAFDFRTLGKEDSKVENFKNVISELVSEITGKFIKGYDYDVFTDEGEIRDDNNFALIPLVEVNNQSDPLSKEDADKINAKFYSIFGDVVLIDIKGKTEDEDKQIANSKGPVYAFSNKGIAQLLPVIMQSPIAYNKELGRFEFVVNLENLRNRQRSFSPDSSSSGEDSLSSSLDGIGFPRQGSEQGAKKETEVFSFLHHTVVPSSQSWQSIGADESVQKADIWLQQKDPWLSQGTHENKWLQSLQPGSSGLSQQRPSLWPQGGHSSRASAWPQPMDPWSSPASSSNIPGFWSPAQVDSRDKPLTEKEEELIKALLNVFNLNNRSCDIVNTNFTLKNGEIVSLLGGYVNREKYLQKVRNCIIGSHGYTEEEAKKIYNLDEFPFSFSPDSDFEEDERTTVLARNTSGAAFNLKTYLIQGFKEDIEEEVIEEQLVEKMKIKEEEARELIRRSVHLEKTNGSTSYLCSISFSNKCFQDQSRFERFKDTYIKAFELRLEKYGWNYSFKHNILYIESAINIDVIKKIEKHIKNEALIRYFIDEDEMEWVPIVFEDECFQLDISCSRYEELTPQRPKFTGSTLKTGKVKQETNDSGFSEGQTEDEKAMSKPSEKQGKSNAVGASASVQEADIWLQQKNPWLLQGMHEDKWLQSPQPGPSGLSQQRPSLWPQGGHSSRTSAWPQPMDPWSSPAPSGDIPGFWSPAQVDSRGKTLNKKEEELIKALLYAFNLNNYILECPNTNFIVENGKIASSINDGVNVKEYLQELRDYTIKYCGIEEKAKEGYDLNEFPFKFLSNCEKNQETTVVANISCGALLNLKKLFIQQKHEQGIGIEDININIIEKTVKSQKDRWVDSQVKGGYCSPRIATENCYPDESELKHIPIIKGKGGYCLDRTYEQEVESFMKERWGAKNTSKAKKMEPEDNQDSGYSSGFVANAERREKPPKRRSQSPVGRGSPEKSLRRDSSPLSSLESLSLSSSSHKIDKRWAY